MVRLYDASLRWALRHSLLILVILSGSTALNFYLFNVIRKGFFPQQDSGTLLGGVQADPGISFQLMRKKLAQIQTVVQNDPAVDTVVANTGGRQTNSGNVWVTLKPLQQRDSVATVTARLREKLSQVSGARLYLQPMQDIHIGGRQSLSQYQFTLQADDTSQVLAWTPKLVDALRRCPELTDLSSDQQQNGLQADLKIDRLTMGRLGLFPGAVDNTLYDAFGERQVSTIYNAMNQYAVVMEVAPEYWQNPETLKKLYVSTSGTDCQRHANLKRNFRDGHCALHRIDKLGEYRKHGRFRGCLRKFGEYCWPLGRFFGRQLSQESGHERDCCEG